MLLLVGPLQICRVSRPQPLVRRLGFFGRAPDLSDQRRIDFAVYGLDIFGGLSICIDATIVSPISAEGMLIVITDLYFRFF